MTDVTSRDYATVSDPAEAQGDKVRSLRADAWSDLRRNPLFWISAVLIAIFALMAIWPGLFTDTSPRAFNLAEARKSPDGENWFGRDVQGYDLYARCIHGARASILVGIFAAAGTAIIGSLFGLIAGYTGGWLDALISRFAEIFFALPLILGAIIILTSLPESNSYFLIVFKVVLVFWVLGWPSIFRLMRSAVLQVRPNDYVQAARALGASPTRIIASHVLPNAVGPVIVVSTINLGVYISAEAALSFIGIGLQPPTVSWGVMISDALRAMRSAPHVLLFPAAFLSVAVLAFIMLGDAVRDAFDPKNR
ncbi:ABC transporter permease [Nocardioides sp. SYSU DS0663]|uniref:ABC transporter permease n=1 Tax=Nocardioides sp. SYSU DS0663 TaxID=3416445 RepID=UPI003F4C8C65